MVEETAAEYGSSVLWEKVVTKDLAGARRYMELSRKLGRPAPVPSIFINGELVYETTPGQEELKACLDRFLGRYENGS